MKRNKTERNAFKFNKQMHEKHIEPTKQKRYVFWETVILYSKIYSTRYRHLVNKSSTVSLKGYKKILYVLLV